MRNQKVEGIVIKRKNVGEADRILTVFTRQFGKIQIKAAGVRRIVSKRASHVELLNVVDLSLYKGSGMPVLLEASSMESFEGLKCDLKKVGYAYHICELIDGLCPENQENNLVFDMLLQVLENLAQNPANPVLIHAFEIDLLRVLGYYSENTHDLKGAKASFFIEHILERKLKSRQVILQMM